MVLHPPDAELVGVGVEPEAAAGAGRLQEPVPPLPGSQELGADADAAAELADPQMAGGIHRPDYTDSGQ